MAGTRAANDVVGRLKTRSSPIGSGGFPRRSVCHNTDIWICDPPDRNLIDLYLDGGVGFVGFVPGRSLDRFGIAVAYMRISDAARNLDRDAQLFSDQQSPVRSNETLLELIYEAHIKPGWLLAPYFQYVFRPSGGIPNPADASGLSRIGDAVFGLTSTLRY